MGPMFTGGCGDDDGESEPAINECVADMEAAARVSGLREDLMEHNQELHPTFTSCTSVEQWEAATVTAGLDDLIDAGFIDGECIFNPGVFGSPLCEAIAASR